MTVSQKQPRDRFVGAAARRASQDHLGDIDLADGYLRVRIGVGKAAREDVIPLHEQVLEALTEAKSVRRQADRSCAPYHADDPHILP